MNFPEKVVYEKLQHILSPEYVTNDEAVLEKYFIEQSGGQSVILTVEQDMRLL